MAGLVLKLAVLALLVGVMAWNHPEFAADAQQAYSFMMSDSPRVFSMMLIVVGLFSGYRKIRRRLAEQATAGGLGMRLDVEDAGWKVIEVVEGSSSRVGGVLVGDVITHVDGLPVANLPSIAVIRGPIDSNVEIKISRGAEELSLNLKRKRVLVPKALKIGQTGVVVGGDKKED